MGLNKNRRSGDARTARNGRTGPVRRFLSRFAGDRRANVLIMFGLTLPILLAIVGAGIDFSYAEDTKVQLQDAIDAAGLAVSAEVVKNPNDTVQTLKTLAQNTMNADFQSGAPIIIDFHVCAPVQSDCTDGSTTMANDTVLITAQATAPCLPLPIPTTVCQGSPPGQTVNSSTTTVIGFGATLQLNIVVDSSASMIVGATQADVTAISNWMSTTTIINEKCGGSTSKKNCVHWGNWNSVMNDPVTDYAQVGGTPVFGTNNTGDNPPCAFACHDDGTSAGVQIGLTNAHAANATTRYDVMITAAKGLITNVQALLNNNANLAKNTYLFNVYSFDDSIHQQGTTNMPCTGASCTGPTNAIGAILPGVDTYLNAAMQTFSASSGTNAIGANGNGTSASSPLKFMILVTDGLQSDRGANWNSTTNLSFEPNWNYPTSATNAQMGSNAPAYTREGGFDGPINLTYCTALKNEGVVLAVLETPYVPLDGSDPHVQPYEQTVRHTIFPGGAGTASTVSAALQSCATTGYYFQANSPTDISTGFTNLTTQFIQQHSYIAK